MPHRLLITLAMAFGAMGLMACSAKSVTEPGKPLDRVSTVASSLSTCAADPAWLTSSTLPTEVPGSQTMCNFQQFMWQSLLALVQPTQDPNKLQFETWMPSYGIFILDKDGTPTPWGQEPPISCKPDPKLSTRAGKTPRFYSDIIKQAGVEQPLIDLKDEFVYYGMSVNRSAYDMLTSCQLYKTHCAAQLKFGNRVIDEDSDKGIDLISKYPNLAFPDTAVELKTSWMVLDDASAASGLFYVVPGLIKHQDGPCRLVNLGLTGIHIVSKTPNFPAMIWATFEHRNNAPDCNNDSASPPLGGAWNFYDPKCKDCKRNIYTGARAQVCRVHPQGNSAIGEFPDDENCTVKPNQLACQQETQQMLAESSAAVNAINSSVQSLIQANPHLINKVWANYELVGNVWNHKGVTSPALQDQRGSLSAANTSMESFVQHGVAGKNNTYNCMSCHDRAGPTLNQKLPPAGLSHLFDSVQMPGGCESGSLPAACSAYTHRR